MNASSINLNSFLSITNEDTMSTRINNIINDNKNEYNKLKESVSIFNEILKEEKQNKDKLLTELNFLRHIHSEAENLFSKIINVCMN